MNEWRNGMKWNWIKKNGKWNKKYLNTNWNWKNTKRLNEKGKKTLPLPIMNEGDNWRNNEKN